jgi:hypothetical protein
MTTHTHTHTPTPLSTKGADLALSVERVLSKLTVCLNQETEAVLQNNRDAAGLLQEEKMHLMERYKGLSEAIERDATQLTQLDDHVRNHIKTISGEFQIALKNNSKALKSAHNAVGRLMDRIMTTARRAVMQDQQTYNAHGSFAGGANPTMTPTKLNQEL